MRAYFRDTVFKLITTSHSWLLPILNDVFFLGFAIKRCIVVKLKADDEANLIFR
jgi:hypothetical protein